MRIDMCMGICTGISMDTWTDRCMGAHENVDTCALACVQALKRADMCADMHACLGEVVVRHHREHVVLDVVMHVPVDERTVCEDMCIAMCMDIHAGMLHRHEYWACV